MKTVLVTGANGFLGRNLCARLTEDRDIRILRFTKEHTPEQLEEYAAQADFVFHLAGVMRPQDPAEFDAVNRGLTESLLQAISKSGKATPLLLTSSIMAEMDNDYGKSKKAAEDAVLTWAAKTGNKAYVYRLPNTFGKWAEPNRSSVVATFCHNAAYDLDIDIHDPAKEMHFAYVDDVINDFLQAMRDDRTPDADALCRVAAPYAITLQDLAGTVRSFKTRPAAAWGDRQFANDLERRLYLTYTSYLEPNSLTHALPAGSQEGMLLLETNELHPDGQVSIVRMRPGMIKDTRRQHAAITKVLFIAGDAQVSCRDPHAESAAAYRIEGGRPAVLDIPPGRLCTIQNVGRSDLVIATWTEGADDPPPHTGPAAKSEVSAAAATTHVQTINGETPVNKPAKKLKVMTILGTRPEIIRLSATIKKCDQYFDHVLVHTGQNWDYTLNQVFFENLGLREPDHYLDSVGKDLGETIGNIIAKSYEVLVKEKPDALLILGDTNSALSAIPAKRLKIPIFHMEAGNRCFDDNVPEEINRRIVDHIADINMPYAEHWRRYLISEGIRKDHIFVTGSPMAEVLRDHMESIDASNILEEMKLEKGKYFVLSAHREENIDNEQNFFSLMNAINHIAETYQMPIIYSTHPRSMDRIKKRGFKLHKLVQSVKPFGFFDYNKLQKNAFCVLSDSGTLSEESSIMGFSAVLLRTSTERPEVFDKGTMVLGGITTTDIEQAVALSQEMKDNEEMRLTATDYQDMNTSVKVVRIIQSYTKVINKLVWDKPRSE